MASNPPCMIEGCEVPSTFIGTFFETGQSVTVCEGHFVMFAAGTLEAMTGVPVSDIIAATFGEPEAEPEDPTSDDVPASSESLESSEVPTGTADHGDTFKECPSCGEFVNVTGWTGGDECRSCGFELPDDFGIISTDDTEPADTPVHD